MLKNLEIFMTTGQFTNKVKGLIRFTVWGFFSMCFLFVQNFFYHIYYKAKYKRQSGKKPFWQFIAFTLVTCNIGCLVSFWDQARDILPKIYQISQYS